jgi:two-component system, NarL family, response regulator NreC
MTKRVLIADDNRVMRHHIRSILELDASVEVCAEAVNGMDAVQKVRECHPDLVVLDFVMPEMNGLEATREIKRLMPALPVLLFTLHDSPALEEESRRAGVDAVIAKEQGRTQLWKVLHQFLG